MKKTKVKEELKPTAYSDWVEAYLEGKNYDATGEASANYNDVESKSVQNAKNTEKDVPLNEQGNPSEIAKSDV